jgi:hypothetical protein
MSFWYEIGLISSIFAVGNIFFGHFEEKTPKWRKLLKFIFMNLLAILITHLFGEIGFYIFLIISFIFFVIIHFWWLPKNGINGWTAEPKVKYYKLRGWIE